MNYLDDALDLPAEQAGVAEEYMEDLLSCALDDLKREPAALSAKLDSLNQELANLCFRSYDALILSHSSYLSVSSSFSSLDTGLDLFLATSQELATTCRSFEGFLNADLNPTRSKLSEALLHVDSVGEVLDLPRLVKACVVNGNWAEALELSKRVTQISALCEGEASSRVMQRVRFQVALELIDLKMRILQSLRDKTLKLPSAVRGISLLRRLEEPAFRSTFVDAEEALTEEKLQLIFLASRWHCLKSQMESLTLVARLGQSSITEISEERVKYVKKWIEIWREVVGDAVNIYAESFLSGQDTNKASQKRQFLEAFLHHAFSELHRMLEANLAFIYSVSSLSTLLTQLAYCAAAFTRFGFDFRVSVAFLMQHRVQIIVTEKFRLGLDNLLSELSPPLATPGFRSPLAPTPNRLRRLSTTLLAPESMSKVSLYASTLQAEKEDLSSALIVTQPAQQLTLYPCLARFVNAIAIAFNELRLIPAVALFPSLKEALDDALAKATEGFLALVESSMPELAQGVLEDDGEEPLDRQKRLSEEEKVRQILVAGVGLLCRNVLPFCEQGLRKGIFGEVSGDLEESELVASSRLRCEGVLKSLLIATAEG